MPRTQPSVEERLEDLLRVEEFAPPPGFAGQVQVRDQALYDRAAQDGPAWWAAQARQRLGREKPFSSVLDDANPPFFTWFADGSLNVSFNCLDRHVLAGHGERVAFHWPGEERDLTYAGLLADTELLAGSDPSCPAEPMEAEHPLFLLYSPGSTAKPKGIVHTTGGYLAGVATVRAPDRAARPRGRRIGKLARPKLPPRTELTETCQKERCHDHY
jgi:acyl-CoA synthetase (AMP-forming)/AMP-acid ligase II